MKLPQLTLRDVLWLTAVIGLSIALFIANDRAHDRENAYKAWGFDIASKILEQKTGNKIIVNSDGVLVLHPNGTTSGYRLPPSP